MNLPLRYIDPALLTMVLQFQAAQCTTIKRYFFPKKDLVLSFCLFHQKVFSPQKKIWYCSESPRPRHTEVCGHLSLCCRSLIDIDCTMCSVAAK